MGTLLRDDPAPVNPVFQATGFDTLSTGYALDTTAADAWTTAPISEALRTADIQASQQGPIIAGGRGGVLRGPPQSPLLTPEQANDQFGIDGELKWDKPVRAATATLQNQFTMDRLKTADQLNRAETGFIPGAARLATSFAVQAMDPLNVAASFVPVVGEARFAELAGRIGLTGARIARGAVEGAVGQGLIEPIALANASAEDRDYTMWNSLSNIAMGVGLGATLHVGAGFLRDRLIGVPEFTQPADHAAAMRGSVAAIADGKPIRVAEYLRFQDEFGRRADLLSGSSLSAGAPEIPLANVLPDLSGQLPEQPIRTGQRIPIDLPTLREDGTAGSFPADTLGFKSEIDRLQTAASAEGRQTELRQLSSGEHALVEPAQLEIIDQFPDERTAQANIKRMPPAERDGLQTVPFTRQDGSEGSAIVRGVSDRQAQAIRDNPGLLDQAIQGVNLTPPDAPREPFSPDMVTSAWRDMIAAQRQTHEMQPQEVREQADLIAQTPKFNKPIAQDQPVSDLEAEMADLDTLVATARAAGKLTPEHEALLAEADQMLADSDNRAAGYAAAVQCIVRGL